MTLTCLCALDLPFRPRALGRVPKCERVTRAVTKRVHAPRDHASWGETRWKLVNTTPVYK